VPPVYSQLLSIDIAALEHLIHADHQIAVIVAGVMVLE